jgi:hypothetical protein
MATSGTWCSPKRRDVALFAHGDIVTDIVIQPLSAAHQADLNRCDNSFTVEAELCLHAEDRRTNCTM